MKKLIPLDLSLAQRLAAVQLENPFCGFCRAERAAVEELKSALAQQPCLPDEDVELLQHLLNEGQVVTPALLQANRGAVKDGRDYKVDDKGIWFTKDFLRDILQRTGAALGTSGTPPVMGLPEAAQKLRDELEQAKATIEEMGALIDQQNVELGSMATHQHRGKGGLYRLLGDATPAGAVKTVIGVPFTVYQDTVSGQLYYRSTHDFAAAMEPV